MPYLKRKHMYFSFSCSAWEGDGGWTRNSMMGQGCWHVAGQDDWRNMRCNPLGKINPGYLLRKIEKQKSSWKKNSQSSAVKMTSGVVSNHPLTAGIMHLAFHFWEVFTQEDSWRGCSNSFHHQASALVANTNLLLLSFLSQGRRINKIPTAGHINFLSLPVATRNSLERSRGWVEISEPCCSSQNLILALLCRAASHRVKGWLKK